MPVSQSIHPYLYKEEFGLALECAAVVGGEGGGQAPDGDVGSVSPHQQPLLPVT